MRSIGIYYREPGRNLCPRLECEYSRLNDRSNHQKIQNNVSEIHCNLWKIQNDGTNNSLLHVIQNPKYSFYLDFGIKFDLSIKSLAIYFPFKIEQKSISDLGKVLAQNQELCSIVFNDDVKTQCSENAFHLVELKDEDLFLYPIGSTNIEIVSSKEDESGSIVYINIHSVPPDDILSSDGKSTKSNRKRNVYIRFRISLDPYDLNSFRREELLSSDIIQSIFSKVEMYDFRINDIREINRKVDEQLKHDMYKPFRMQKVHFFLMLDSRNTLSQSSMPAICRFLETEKWNDYMSVNLPQNMIAYHWKDQKDKELEISPNSILSLLKNGIENMIFWKRGNFSNFRLFFILTYPHRSKLQICFYCLLAIVLGAMGSILCNLLGINDLLNISLTKNWANYIAPILVLLGLIISYILLKYRSKLRFLK